MAFALTGLVLRIRALVALAILAASSAACDKQSPAEPSTVAGAGAGVSIAGTVSSPVPAGLRVTVGGTSNSAPVDGGGQFTITDAPSGTVDLRFSGGANATLVLTDLQPQQNVTLVVTVSGMSATLESARRVRGSEEQLEGRVESVSPPNTLVVAGRTVSTGAATTFTASGQFISFNTLAAGQRISVKGQSTSGALVAAQVDVMSPVSASGLTMGGTIANLSGTRDAFQFMLNGLAVRGDAKSIFISGSQVNELGDGLQIMIQGGPQSGQFYAERLILMSQGVTMSGTIAGRTGTAPQLMLNVAGQNILVSAFTEVARMGNPQNANAIATGQRVDVRGRTLPDGTIVAGTINILADAPGGAF